MTSQDEFKQQTSDHVSMGSAANNISGRMSVDWQDPKVDQKIITFIEMMESAINIVKTKRGK